MISARIWLLGLAVMALSACTPEKERRTLGRIQPLSGGDAALVELSGGSLALVSLADGAVQWRHRSRLVPSPTIDFSERYRLVCPVAQTPAGDLVLRYDRELKVISRQDGQLRWKIHVYRWASGARRCPAVTADSGVLLLRRQGLVLQKLAANGAPAWQYRLLSVGSAVGPPEVAPESGDVMLRTTSHLVVIKSGGALRWALPLSQLDTPAEPHEERP